MDKSENKFCVYTHARPDTGQVFYVGIGNKKRPYKKVCRSVHWKNIVAKNNGVYGIEILCENQTWDSVCQIEIRLISEIGRKNKKMGSLCNLTDGGEGTVGFLSSEAQRKANSERGKLRATPEFIEYMRKVSTGRKHTVEAKRKISESQLGRKMSADFCKKLSQNKKGNKYNLGKKRTEDAKRRIGEASRDRVRLVENIEKGIITDTIRRGWVIEQVCKSSLNTVKRYINCKSAERDLGISASSIAGCVKGRVISAGGFFWRKSYDLSDVDNLLTIDRAA